MTSSQYFLTKNLLKIEAVRGLLYATANRLAVFEELDIKKYFLSHLMRHKRSPHILPGKVPNRIGKATLKL